MRRGLIPALLVGFLLAGCSSKNPPATNPNTSTSTSTSSSTGTVTSSSTGTVTSTSTGTGTSPDAGCDEDAVGENYYIQNCIPGGNGTPILRLPDQAKKLVANSCQP